MIAIMIFVAIIAAYSCRSHNKAIKESVSTLIGSTIIFPDSLCAINNYQVEDKELLLLDNKMKFVMYIPSETCSTCHISKINFSSGWGNTTCRVHNCFHPLKQNERLNCRTVPSKCRGTPGDYYMKYCSSCTYYGHFAMDVVAFCNN